MNRREIITLIGGAAVMSPPAARAQQLDRMRRIGVLMGYDESDPEAKAYLAAFMQGLAELGWTAGRDVRTEVRWSAGKAERTRMMAKELVGLRPAVILTGGTAMTAALRRETQTIPIVFTLVGDPVGDGFVAGLPCPGGNITGFISQEASTGSKWLELLTEMAHGLQRVAIMFNPDTAPGGGSYFLPSFEAAARSFKVAPIVAPVHSDSDIEKVMASLAGAPGGGLLVMPEIFTMVHRERIISLAARDKTPSVYAASILARDGGLLSYGPDYRDNFCRAASYVDRILKGEKPGDLPVQQPTKFELVINLKTAKALGLTVPPGLLVSADEVIE